jgi:hypothetical protein
MPHHAPECRSCAQGQRLSTLTFAVFAALLAGAALDPGETPARQAALGLCAALAGLAVFRHAIARAVARNLQRRRKIAPR